MNQPPALQTLPSNPVSLEGTHAHRSGLNCALRGVAKVTVASAAAAVLLLTQATAWAQTAPTEANPSTTTAQRAWWWWLAPKTDPQAPVPGEPTALPYGSGYEARQNAAGERSASNCGGNSSGHGGGGRGR